ncbi:DNA alkylation repair protein, partial [Vibrio parahaemolyticus]
YSKVNPKWVKEFVEANDLTPLSKREALKRL